MFKHGLHGISIAAILDTRRANANGSYPVRVKVHYQKNKKYYTTGKTCSIEMWDRMPTTKAQELIEMRSDIQACFEVIKKHVLELHGKDEFSLSNLDKSLRRSSGVTLNELIENKMKNLKKDGQIGTMQSYNSTLANIAKFKGNSIPIENVTVEWLKDFEKFMAKERSVTTIAINMRNIRTMMNVAVKENYIKQSLYPFGVGKFEIQTAEGVKKALSFDQIKKIKKFKGEDPKLLMYRDIWLFIYYCNGINIADLIQLKYSNIIDGEIRFVREKTKRTSKILKPVLAIVTKEMQDIIDRWGNENKPDNYIFNLVKHSKDPEVGMTRKKWFTKDFNQHLKMIGTAVGVQNISSYSARHSFATVLKRKGANIAFISECLGHTSLNTTQSYLDSFEKEERIKNAALLSDL